jgi:glycosyltransferase involved in cell wall biosynthesis
MKGENSKMKSEVIVGYLTSVDPTDKRPWSGTHYRMLKSLEKEFVKVIPLGPVKETKALKLAYKFLKLLFKIGLKEYNTYHSMLRSKYLGRHLKKRVDSERVDVLFAPAGSPEIAFLKTTLPICYLTDTSFNQIKDYYDNYSGLSPLSVKESNIIEKRAIDASKTLVFSSDWAANYAIDYYKADPRRVFVVKFGANLDHIPDMVHIQKDYNNNINLLFLAVKWQRKGGDIVFKTFEILLEKGYDVTLIVCGCVPPVKHTKMTVLPFLNKNNETDNKRINQLLMESHILFVPTRADCTPIVFCEANAFGIPVITTNTGGIPSIVEDGVNGYALPYSASANDYALCIQSLLDNREKLKEMSKMSRDRYDSELNWDSWGEKIKPILTNMI